MRRTAVLLLSALAAAWPVQASAQRPSTPSGTLELVQRDRETRFKLVDAPPLQGERRPPSPGDVAIVSGVLRHPSGRRGGRRAGRLQAYFTTFSRGRRYSAEVAASFRLRGGAVMVQGPVGHGRVDRVAIVGGTGTYAGARGTLTATSGRTQTRFVFAFLP